MTANDGADDGTDRAASAGERAGNAEQDERGGAPATPGRRGGSTDDRVVSVLGFDVAIEEAFLTFPWRAGVLRAPLAFAVSFVLVVLLASVGGFGDGDFADQLAYLGVITYNAHNVPAAIGYVPDLLTGVAEPVVELAVIGRLLRGLFVVGFEHGEPLTHLSGIVGGETDTIGHRNFIDTQAETKVPAFLYYLAPISVLVGVGYEYADSHWDEATTDSLLEVVRFGIAIALGYVAVLLLGTVAFTVTLFSPLGGSVLVLPDRYLAVVFGFVYPAVFSSVGAALVYVRRDGIGGSHRDDADDPVADGATGDDLVGDDARVE